MCLHKAKCIWTAPLQDCAPSHANRKRSGIGGRPESVAPRSGLALATYTGQKRNVISVSQLFQKQQVVFDCLRHGRMLPIGYAIFFGGLLHDPGQRGIVSVALKRAQMMDDMVIESADKPSDKRVLGCVVGGRGENVMDPVIELVAVRGKVRAVDHMRGLEYERNAQTDNQMGKHESQSHQRK